MRLPWLSLPLLAVTLSACAPSTVSDLNTGLRAYRALSQAPRVELRCADEQGFTRAELRPGSNTCLLAVSVPEDIQDLEVRVGVQYVYLEGGGLFSKPTTKTRDTTVVQAVDRDSPYVQGELMVLPFGQYVKSKSLLSLDLGRTFEGLNSPNMRIVARLAPLVGFTVGLDPAISTGLVYGGKLALNLTAQLREIYRLDLNPVQLRFNAAVCVTGSSTCSPSRMTFVGVQER